MQAPPIDAPFADKMAYYRTQHTSKGVNVTTRSARRSSPSGCCCCSPSPALGRRCSSAAGPCRSPATGVREEHALGHKGWITYQLTGVIQALETYGEMLARRRQRKVASAAPTPPTDAITGARPATMAA